MKTLTKKKKIIILSVMVALLLVTGFVNVALNSTLSTDLSTPTSSTSANFYSNYRTDRENTRLQEIQHYNEIIASATASDESKADAEEKKLALITQMEKELVTEGIIRGKGFEDVVITTSSSNINVFIKASELTETEVAQITSVVTTQMNVEIDKIIIIPSE
ncbi:MAG TPA: SpoIIIAH-like family protein [Candidatus Onthoplasma faecipullorum]|mgnify:FL=1|nr:SpoIIIAH-like family protein [Candidatus Onthoplasma faecipullorum]